ncbi:hypothetical protein [Salmon gill poxvirus]|uniref:Uncharacterized protein n=1 Tax=Salmon gill poxvirus TaxID=1680908 RepID=A0A0H4Y179_9POXV|nr:hypothetical protein AL387_gp038 [Salmon gill poxvirus]AKR04162.1 hypothetical protein SGPV038 [Salmon gill poxvirus]
MSALFMIVIPLCCVTIIYCLACACFRRFRCDQKRDVLPYYIPVNDLADQNLYESDYRYFSTFGTYDIE